jgi:hypothetical protein
VGELVVFLVAGHRTVAQHHVEKVSVYEDRGSEILLAERLPEVRRDEPSQPGSLQRLDDVAHFLQRLVANLGIVLGQVAAGVGEVAKRHEGPLRLGNVVSPPIGQNRRPVQIDLVEHIPQIPELRPVTLGRQRLGRRYLVLNDLARLPAPE